MIMKLIIRVQEVPINKMKRSRAVGKTILTFFIDLEVNQGADGDGCGLESPTKLQTNFKERTVEPISSLPLEDKN